jgi:hypothetical protein
MVRITTVTVTLGSSSALAHGASTALHSQGVSSGLQLLTYASAGNERAKP